VEFNLNVFADVVYRGGFAEVLCKPKILPLKSQVLEQLSKRENAEDIAESNAMSFHK
jgi:hypothetical protein